MFYDIYSSDISQLCDCDEYLMFADDTCVIYRNENLNELIQHVIAFWGVEASESIPAPRPLSPQGTKKRDWRQSIIWPLPLAIKEIKYIKDTWLITILSLWL